MSFIWREKFIWGVSYPSSYWKKEIEIERIFSILFYFWVQFRGFEVEKLVY